jgi:beta-fructofuranosidase
MMIASGERQHGPQLHLYKSDSLASASWDYVSTVLDVKAHEHVSQRSALKWGLNFECASFFSMGGTDYIVVGIEEDEQSTHHNGHYILWVSGKFALNSKGLPVFRISGHGKLDHGVLYAAHIFKDAHGRLVQLGWADETANEQAVHDQGWAGCLAHPREMFQIVKPLEQCADSWPEWQLDKESGTMTTLGIRPAPQVETLRAGPGPSSLEAFKRLRSNNFEMQATFSDLRGTETFIFNVLQSPDTTDEVTMLIFDLDRQQILVDRSQSSLKQLGDADPDVGHLRLLPGEDLTIRVFVDVSVIEVYANDRFALTSRVYPSLEASTATSYDFGEFDKGKVRFECWDGLNNAWPARASGQSVLPELHPLHKRTDLNSVKRKSLL